VGLQINEYLARQTATFSNSKWRGKTKTFAYYNVAAQGVQEIKVRRFLLVYFSHSRDKYS
jgi:hypothetical protein